MTDTKVDESTVKALRERFENAREHWGHDRFTLMVNALELSRLLDAADALAKERGELARLNEENRRLRAQIKLTRISTFQETLKECLDMCEQDPAALEYLRPTLQQVWDALAGTEQREGSDSVGGA